MGLCTFILTVYSITWLPRLKALGLGRRFAFIGDFAPRTYLATSEGFLVVRTQGWCCCCPSGQRPWGDGADQCTVHTTHPHDQSYPAISVNATKTEKSSSRVIHVWISRDYLIMSHFFINGKPPCQIDSLWCYDIEFPITCFFSPYRQFQLTYSLQFSFKVLPFPHTMIAAMNVIPTSTKDPISHRSPRFSFHPLLKNQSAQLDVSLWSVPSQERSQLLHVAGIGAPHSFGADSHIEQVLLGRTKQSLWGNFL